MLPVMQSYHINYNIIEETITISVHFTLHGYAKYTKYTRRNWIYYTEYTILDILNTVVVLDKSSTELRVNECRVCS